MKPALAVAALALLVGCGGPGWHVRAAFLPAPHGIPVLSRSFPIDGPDVRVYVGPVRLRDGWTPLVRRDCIAARGAGNVTRARFARSGASVRITFENGFACPHPADLLVRAVAGPHVRAEWLPVAILSR